MTSSLEARSQNPAHFDRRHSSPGPEYELGTVVPVQFYDLIRRSAFLDGERRLVFAVLEDAVRTYLRLRDSRRRADRIEFAEVARWFRSKNGSRSFFLRVRLRSARNQPRSASPPNAHTARRRAADEAVALCRTAPARSQYSLREETFLVGCLAGCEELDATRGFEFKRFNTLCRSCLFTYNISPLGETRERERALKITFPTAC